MLVSDRDTPRCLVIGKNGGVPYEHPRYLGEPEQNGTPNLFNIRQNYQITPSNAYFKISIFRVAEKSGVCKL